MSPSPVSRRDLLLSGALLPMLGASAAPVAGRVRNIIFMVSDGMSAGVPQLTESFSRVVRGGGTRWEELAADPATVRGYLRTESLSSMVTDSAAASSAWGSGRRVANGAINVLPDGTRLGTIAGAARATRRRVGLVTTTTVTHATPAGFAARQPNRDHEESIAPQYLDRVDVILGGGAKFFDGARRGDGRDLAGAYRRAGYAVCATAQELEAARSARVLGTFAEGHLPFRIDQRHAPAAHVAVPTLAVMTRAALQRLRRAEGGFLLQVEGGRVDHAAHQNDAAALLWEQLDFDDAIGEALSFLDEEPNTLIVVTTDHGNASPSLNGMGRRYAASAACFERLAPIAASFPVIRAALGCATQPCPVEEVIAIVHARTGIELSNGEAAAVARARNGEEVDDLNPHHRGFVGTLGQALGRYTGIGFTGTEHTAELALTLAVGAGRERFAGVMHHADVHTALVDLMRA